MNHPASLNDVDFSPRIDVFVRFFGIWLAGTSVASFLLMSAVPTMHVLLLFLLAAVPSISLAWVYTKQAIRISTETNKTWVRHAVSARVIGSVSVLVSIIAMACYYA